MSTQKVTEQLYQSGDFERLSQVLEQNLEQCGWATEMRDYARSLIKADNTIHFQDLYEKLLKAATESFPSSLKVSMLQEIKSTILKMTDVAQHQQDQGQN
ncbi:SAGA complex subunit Sus1 [Schizosaccharomyces japonicus yFS275]|uniref:SAGA complex subunit Sus1 n=1 Tax=Schizosaccharomyces japonicus (strain yFS275 / FY16936) TaxID=402676 RepID=B6JW71_SCHJY|nr:SAGA complex subunit Sus1 [Schizosaccharomyces japonicus yFS275]EEB05622.1 SAGA complex subunit Sus1 [Schizosaccharomyces japonicus yFS275]